MSKNAVEKPTLRRDHISSALRAYTDRIMDGPRRETVSEDTDRVNIQQADVALFPELQNMNAVYRTQDGPKTIYSLESIEEYHDVHADTSADNKTAPEALQIGDRVRRQGFSHETPGIIADIDTGDGEAFVRLASGSVRWFPSTTLELVERGWYAPPGIAMLALTPKVLAAIAFFREHLDPAIVSSFASDTVQSANDLDSAITTAQDHALRTVEHGSH